MNSKVMVATVASLISSSIWASVNLEKQLESVGATNVKIAESALPGFKTAVSDQGVVQISQDGRFVIYGKVFELKSGKAIDITNNALMKQLNALSNEMIVFPAKNQKYVVNIFTDITCQYCHILHQQIKEYNDLGITIRYLAFPRGGLNTQVAKQMEAVWSAEDKVFALNEAESGRLPKTVKTPSVVKKHYNLGIQFGITGTPSIITSEGEVIPGYVEPKELLKMLQSS
ncbi:bifunctional protein-disulfide isomerase/oxidoreductase DsbC [Vespertiliibacter pulmonis]|uniref:Thiol:disulfide interchange protein n=2 Tax=Vespertiliibacter pulmonis TaxID=1443036 RepID=A0A3N4VX31_9PAST|nr:bifunctional protein-disulfide isomerase/oxidoreductase DsbC [Vespertiliibacter pulmonis]RPE85805.1 thiol:disulfide interchange protein DsbC [Vespertiliibacter pulmonis]